MRFACIPFSAMLWFALLACYSQLCHSVPVAEDASALSKSVDEDNQQDWHKNLPPWSKRAWQNLQGGWGKRYANADKKSWQSLQSGWGKRKYPQMDAYAVKALASALDQDYLNQDFDSDYVMDANGFENNNNGEEKRSWRSLSGGGGWGKRSDWGNFRGSWGKRDPAWTNLKGN